MESVRIPLTQGQVAVIDPADAALINQWRWRASRSRSTFYARTGPPYEQLWMHRVILGLPPGRFPEVDHINGDGLDNRRDNIRIATSTQNKANTGRRRQNRSGYKGVWAVGDSWASKRGGIYLGMFDTAEEAARAYDTAARMNDGAFAKPNFPTTTTSVTSRVGGIRRNNTSGYRGVGFRPAERKWVARFNWCGKRLFLGLFSTKEDAARAWDVKAREVLGPSARLNFPDN